MNERRKHIIRTAIFILSIALLTVWSLCLTMNTKADDTVNVDLTREDQYQVIFEENEITIWYYETSTNHYLFIEALEEFSGDLVVDNLNGTKYNFGFDLQKDDISSMHDNVTAELRLKRETMGNHFKFSINGRVIELRLEPKFPVLHEEVPSPWTGWTATIIVVIVWVISNAVRNVKKKIYLECWIEKTRKDGTKYISKELEVLGEWKAEEHNQQDDCIDFEMRSGTEHFIVHSQRHLSEYKSHHTAKRYLWVRLFILGLCYSKPLNEKKKVKLGWSNWAKFLRFVLIIFNWNWYGLVLSPFIWAVSLSVIFPAFYPIIAIGWGIGWGLNTLVYYNQKHDHWIPKRKEIEVDEERFLVPWFPETIIRNVYQVRGTRVLTRETADGATQAYEEEFCENVTGDEELYRIRKDERINVESWETVEQVSYTRSPQEINQLKLDYMSMARELYEHVFHLKKRNAALQRKIKELALEKEFLAETQQNDLMNTLSKMDKMRNQRQNTLIKFFEDQFGRAFVQKNLDKSVERAERIIQAERDKAKANKMQELVDLMYKLIDMIGSKANLRTESLQELIRLKGEIENEPGT